MSGRWVNNRGSGSAGFCEVLLDRRGFPEAGVFTPSLSDLTPLIDMGEAPSLRPCVGVDSEVSMESGWAFALAAPSSSLILLILLVAGSSSSITTLNAASSMDSWARLSARLSARFEQPLETKQ